MMAAVSAAVLLLLPPLDATAEPTLAERYSEASAAYGQGDFARAADLARRMAEAAAKGSREYAGAVEIEALSLQRMGALSQAEALYVEVLATREALPDLPVKELVSAVSNIGFLRQAQGRYGEAELSFRRTLEMVEAGIAADDPAREIARVKALNNLGFALKKQGRLAAAEPFYKRALDLARGVTPPTRDSMEGAAFAHNNLGALYASQLWEKPRSADAAFNLHMAQMIRQSLLPADHVDLAVTRLNLGAALIAEGRLADAAALFHGVLAVLTAKLPKGHPEIAQVINNLAVGHARSGNPGEAESMYHLAIESLVEGHPYRTIYEANLAALYLDNKHWREAAETAFAAGGDIIRRARVAADPHRTLSPVSGAQELSFAGNVFELYVRAAYEVEEERQRAADPAFVFAQWSAQDAASHAIGELAQRLAIDDDLVASLIRDRQDRAWAREALVQQAYALKLLPDADRDREAEAAVDARIAGHESEIRKLDHVIAAGSPAYAELAQPQALSVAEVQALLQPDEALVFATAAGADLHVWAVTKTGVRWTRAAKSAADIGGDVAALRCGLDRTAWRGGGEACAALAAGGFTASDAAAGKPLPFDTARAHALYSAVLGGVGDLIAGASSLLVVMPGALAEIPPHVLVTASPEPGKAIRWLSVDHAVTVLPSVSALKALRETTTPSRATRAMIGFGNPTLEGAPSAGVADRVRAAAAAYRQSCDLPPGEAEQQLKLAAGFTLGADAAGAVADEAATADWVRRLDPVPSTATLLCALAAEAAFKDSTVLLGRAATKRAVVEMSRSGELARYRLVHFATHGLLPAPARSRREAGLVLTPADGEGDGYLTASDIAALRLDAEAVVLSACNTAGAGAAGAAALSGLARAFLYAQARAVVVSHWEVDEQAAVALVASAVTRAGQERIGIGRALQAAMRELASDSDPAKAHPSYWAPFVVVGDARPPG